MDKLSDIDASTTLAGLMPSIWAGVADPYEVGLALKGGADAAPASSRRAPSPAPRRDALRLTPPDRPLECAPASAGAFAASRARVARNRSCSSMLAEARGIDSHTSIAGLAETSDPEDDDGADGAAVSYTHLTLPTILLV